MRPWDDVIYRICRRCATVDVQRNDDRAERDVSIARDCDIALGPAQKVALDLGQGVVNARKVSDNKIQLKFRTKDFEGEYFHYTGDLFFIYKSGHLMKLTCQKRES